MPRSFAQAFPFLWNSLLFLHHQVGLFIESPGGPLTTKQAQSMLANQTLSTGTTNLKERAAETETAGFPPSLASLSNGPHTEAFLQQLHPS